MTTRAYRRLDAVADVVGPRRSPAVRSVASSTESAAGCSTDLHGGRTPLSNDPRGLGHELR